MDELEKVLKGLKNNKCMDPVGMINETFKEGSIGKDLKDALLMLFKGQPVHPLSHDYGQYKHNI